MFRLYVRRRDVPTSWVVVLADTSPQNFGRIPEINCVIWSSRAEELNHWVAGRVHYYIRTLPPISHDQDADDPEFLPGPMFRVSDEDWVECDEHFHAWGEEEIVPDALGHEAIMHICLEAVSTGNDRC
jgi:hypothetical protein